MEKIQTQLTVTELLLMTGITVSLQGHLLKIWKPHLNVYIHQVELELQLLIMKLWKGSRLSRYALLCTETQRLILLSYV